MATPPVFYPPGAIVMSSRRTSERRAFLKPTVDVVQAYSYCLAYMIQKYELEFHGANLVMSHDHKMITDPHGDRIPAFNRDLNSLLARCLNCYYGRCEYFWDPAGPGDVEVAPFGEDVIDKLAYILTNPVKDGLVDIAKKWPALIGNPATLGREAYQIHRPEWFFDPEGDMPESVTLRPTLPRVRDMAEEDVRRLLIAECKKREREAAEKRRESGRSTLGVKRARRRSHLSVPKSPAPLKSTKPILACKNPDLRASYLEYRKRRDNKYRESLVSLRGGALDVVFPVGSWAMGHVLGWAREAWPTSLWDLISSAPG